MAGTFPTSLPSYTNPAPGDSTAAEIGTRTHSEFHGDINDDVEGLATKLGTGASTPSANTVLRGTGAGTTAYGQIVAADIANDTITATQLAADSVGASELADNSVASANIIDDSIVNADVNSAAAIAVTKIAHVGANNVLKSNGTTNVAGQVATADIAADAVTKSTSMDFATVPVTSTTLVQVGTTMNITSSGGPHYFIWAANMGQGTAGGDQYMTFRVDGGADRDLHYESRPAGATSTRGGEWSIGVLSPGAHTVTVWASVSAGEFYMIPAEATVREYKK